MWSCARGIDFSPNSEDLSPKTPCLLGRGCLSLGRGLLTKGWGISSGEKLPWVDAQVSPSAAPGVLPWLRAGSAPKGWGDGQTVVRCSQWGWWRGRCHVIYTPHARSSHMGGASAHVPLVVLTDFHKGGGEVSPWPPQLTACSGFQLQLQAGPRWRPDVSGTEQTEWDRLAGLDGAESWGEKSCMDRDQLPVQGQLVSWGSGPWGIWEMWGPIPHFPVQRGKESGVFTTTTRLTHQQGWRLCRKHQPYSISDLLFSQGRKNPRGRVTAGMRAKHWQCHIAFPFLLCTELFVFPWIGNELLKMYFIHLPYMILIFFSFILLT